MILATINATTSAVVFALIGLPSWLALAICTGLVAQFIPTIGTDISILLAVLVGLLSPAPWTGVAALVWAVVYQQVENLTFEPKISARAVDVHPAVAFASVCWVSPRLASQAHSWPSRYRPCCWRCSTCASTPTN